MVNSPTPSTWIERWTDAGGNNPNYCASASGGVLHSACGGVFSKKHWDQTQPITATGTVRGQTSSPYFCGLAVLQDGNIYAQTAVGRDVAPANEWGPGNPGLVWWSNEYGEPDGQWFPYQYAGPVDQDAWQSFTVSWNGHDTWSASWNGQQLGNISRNPLTAPVLIDLQGGPQGPGVCDFGTIQVTGVQVP